MLAMSLATAELGETLSSILELPSTPYGLAEVESEESVIHDDTTMGREMLRDRVLRDGRVLNSGRSGANIPSVVDVSRFMDSTVDIALMDACADDIVRRFARLRPTTVLTVETNGLAIAVPVAKRMSVSMVYARKRRVPTMASTYHVSYKSASRGTQQELWLARENLNEDDRVLIVDDFLSSGATQDAILRMCTESGAQVVGVAVLLEKSYEAGRTFLSGYRMPIHSLVQISDVSSGIIECECSDEVVEGGRGFGADMYVDNL